MENFCWTLPHVMASLMPGLLPGNLLSSSGMSGKFPFLFWLDLWLFYCFNADMFFEEKCVFLSLWEAAFCGCLCLATFFQELTTTLIRKESKDWSGHRFPVGDHGDDDLIRRSIFIYYVLCLNFYVRLVLTVPCSTLWKSSFAVAFKVLGHCECMDTVGWPVTVVFLWNKCLCLCPVWQRGNQGTALGQGFLCCFC